MDTSVIVAAQRSRSGASAALVTACMQGEFQMFATASLFLEYEAVLTRPEHGLSPPDREKLLKDLAEIIENVRIDFQ